MCSVPVRSADRPRKGSTRRGVNRLPPGRNLTYRFTFGMRLYGMEWEKTGVEEYGGSRVIGERSRSLGDHDRTPAGTGPLSLWATGSRA